MVTGMQVDVFVSTLLLKNLLLSNMFGRKLFQEKRRLSQLYIQSA